jgi:EsV-1-7 cysteine-rich motif
MAQALCARGLSHQIGCVTDGVARYCVAHKKDFMVDVTHTKCAHEGCCTRPTCGHAHDGKAIFCAAHKEPSMVNVVKGTCEMKGCERQPSHGLLSDKVCMCALYMYAATAH